MTTPTQALRAARRELSKAGSSARISIDAVVKQYSTLPPAIPPRWRGIFPVKRKELK